MLTNTAFLSFWKLLSILAFSSVSVAMAIVRVDICCFSWLIVADDGLASLGDGEMLYNKPRELFQNNDPMWEFNNDTFLIRYCLL